MLIPSEGILRLTPTHPGVVTQRLVHEGQVVRKGDVLFVLTSERSTSTRVNAERTISSLLSARRDSLVIERGQLQLQVRARASAAQQRMQALRSDVQRIDDAIRTQGDRVELSRATHQRYVDLSASGFVSKAQVLERQADVLDQQQRLTDLQRNRAAAEREVSTAESDLADMQMQARRDAEALERSIASAEQDLTESDARREMLVRAPRAGIVSAVMAEVGQTVTTSHVLAAVLPEGSELEANLFAPSRAIGLLKPGMSVLLRYQAFPYQKFGQAHGQIREVSSTAVRPEDAGAEGLGVIGEPVYRVRVRLERQTVMAFGQEEPLRAGATLEGSLVLERRRLIEWMLEPLLTVSGKLTNDH